MYKLFLILIFGLFTSSLSAQSDDQKDQDNSLQQMDEFEQLLEQFGFQGGSGIMMDTMIFRQFGDMDMQGFDGMDLNKAMEDMMNMMGSQFGDMQMGDMESIEEMLKQFGFGDESMFMLPDDFQNLDSIPNQPAKKKVKTYKL